MCSRNDYENRRKPVKPGCRNRKKGTLQRNGSVSKYADDDDDDDDATVDQEIENDEEVCKIAHMFENDDRISRVF